MRYFEQKLKLLGENVKKMRIEQNMTLEELSAKSNIRKEYLQKIEDGQAVKIKIMHFDRLCIGLNTTLDELLNFYG